MTEERILEIAKKHNVSSLGITQILVNAIKEALAEEKDNLVGYWSTDDFMHYCEVKEGRDDFFELTPEEADDCMQILKKEADSERGVKWDDIGRIIANYKDAKGK
jgi:hypothetical protein